jgi:FKBP-type peptidyl-prolyl cis-trans isomerase FklB
MQRTVFIFLLTILASSWGFAAERPTLNNEDDKVNYSVGHQVGRDLLRQQVEVNQNLLLLGILDAISGDEPLMSADDMITTLAGLKEKIVKEHEERSRNIRLEGEDFLTQNRNASGVVSLPSGLQYKIMKPGTGNKPMSGDMVKVNYISKTINDKIFDTTYDGNKTTPVEFGVDNVIPGWSEGLKLMREGAKWELYVPYNLAFKDASPLAGQTVIFEIELLQVASQ